MAVDFPLSPNVGDIYSANTKSWTYGGYGWKALSAAGAIVTSNRQTYTATDGQTLFTTPTYQQGANQISLFINGVKQYSTDYTETSDSSITLTSGATSGDSVLIEVNGYTGQPLVINTPSIINDNTTASSRYIPFLAASSGSMPLVYTNSSYLYYTPSTGILNANGISFPDGTTQTSAAPPTAGIYANGAFLQANNAYSTTNAAFIQANAAYNKANTISLTTIFNGYSNVAIVNASGNVTVNVANTLATTFSNTSVVVPVTLQPYTLRAAANNYNAYPLGTGFSHTLAANGVTYRTVNFDGNGYNPSVWWTNGANALFAIDASTGGGGTIWSNVANTWQQQIAVGYGTTTIWPTTTSTSTTTGALVVNGGAGVAGNIFANGLVVNSNNYLRSITVGGGELSMIAQSGGNAFINVSDYAGNSGSSFNLYLRGLATSGTTQATLTGIYAITSALYCSGDVYSSYSDINLKDKTGNITNAVDKICSIETLYYTPNEKAREIGVTEDGVKVGVSAQSVQKVAPEVVHRSGLDENYLTVQYERLVPYLIEAIKEQQEQIEFLKDEIKLLKGE